MRFRWILSPYEHSKVRPIFNFWAKSAFFGSKCTYLVTRKKKFHALIWSQGRKNFIIQPYRGGVYFLHFKPKNPLSGSKCTFGSKIENRSNFGVLVRTQNSTKSHFFNCLSNMPPLSSIWDGARMSTIHRTPILTYIFDFHGNLPSKIKVPVRTQNSSKIIFFFRFFIFIPK